MNKGDLVGEVAKAINSKKQAQEAVDCYLLNHHPNSQEEGRRHAGRLWNLQGE